MLQLVPVGVRSAVEHGMAMCTSGEQVQHYVHAHTMHAMATSGACAKQHVSLSAWPQLMSKSPEHHCEHNRNASPFHEYVGCVVPPSQVSISTVSAANDTRLLQCI